MGADDLPCLPVVSLTLEVVKRALLEAEAEVERLRGEHSRLGDALGAEDAASRKEALRRSARALTTARDRADAARIAVQVFAKTGDTHGIVAERGLAVGTVAVDLPPGTGKRERDKRVDAALGDALAAAAAQLGVVLASSPERYTRERPGRDPQGRTVLDVAGRVEGDVLMPAVSKAAKRVTRD